MQLPNDYLLILFVGLLLIASTAAVSLALSIDSFRSESFYQAARILNSVTIGYTGFLIFGFIFYYARD